MKQQFSIGQILSVTTGVLCVNDFHEVCTLLNFMTQDKLWTHQLGRAADECTPYIHQQLPWTKDINPEHVKAGLSGFGGDPQAVAEAKEKLCLANVAQLAGKYGEFHTLYPIGHEDHERIHPLDEIKRMGLDDD